MKLGCQPAGEIYASAIRSGQVRDNRHCEEHSDEAISPQEVCDAYNKNGRLPVRRGAL
jgi:hypothetical protein